MWNLTYIRETETSWTERNVGKTLIRCRFSPQDFMLFIYTVQTYQDTCQTKTSSTLSVYLSLWLSVRLSCRAVSAASPSSPAAPLASSLDMTATATPVVNATSRSKVSGSAASTTPTGSKSDSHEASAAYYRVLLSTNGYYFILLLYIKGYSFFGPPLLLFFFFFFTANNLNSFPRGSRLDYKLFPGFRPSRTLTNPLRGPLLFCNVVRIWYRSEKSSLSSLIQALSLFVL